MKDRSKTAFLCFLVLLATWGLMFSNPPTSGIKTIFEAARAPLVDGKLDDWQEIEAFPVEQTLDGLVREPSGDLTVRARFTFDGQYFYAAVEAADDLVEFPEAGSKPSDGFYLGFVEPEGRGSSRQSLVFGFSRRGETELKVLANRNGEIFPPSFTKDIQLKIVADAAKKTIVYEVAIPWMYIPFFRPFFQPEWGINLLYTDIDRGREKIVALHPDPEFESETAGLEKAAAFRFEVRPMRSPEFQSLLKANHSFPDEERILRLAVNSPQARQGWETRLILSSAAGISSAKLPLSFSQGLSFVEFPVAIEKPKPGLYDLSLGILDEKGILRFTENHQFFLLDRSALEGYISRLEEIKKKDLFSSDSKFRESVPSVEIRLEWIKDFINHAPPFADIDAFQQWDEDLKAMLKSLEEGRPALLPAGRIARLAYRSPRDGSLLPVSVLIPEFSDEKTALPLLVVLSFRGRNEGQATLALAAAYFRPEMKRRAGDFIILAPGVSDRSGWFAGSSEEEILAAIEQVKKIYRVNEKAIFLFGWSKGASSALRLGLLRPDVFRGVVIRSGRLIAPAELRSESVFDLLERGRNLRLLFVHGDQDEKAPVEDLRRAVAKLQAVGADVRLIEVKGGGHGDFDRWPEIFSWLREVLGSDLVELKPPKKPSKREKEKEDKDDPTFLNETGPQIFSGKHALKDRSGAGRK